MNTLSKSAEIIRNRGISGFCKSIMNYANRNGFYYPIILKNYTTNVMKYGREFSPRPFKLLWIDPNEVRRVGPSYHVDSGPNFSKFYDTGRIIGGDWDLEKECEEFHNFPKYQSVKKRFLCGYSWEETEIYTYLLKEIEEHGSIDGCRSKSDLEKRYRDIDLLFESINQNGYQTQSELHHDYRNCNSIREVCINIGRHGEFIFGGGGGWHRLSIAKILDLDEIPVHVIVRHKQWQNKRVQAINGNINISHSDI